MKSRFYRYERGLFPDLKFLSDRAVIVQAWKKAHEYIRRHNWYSDNFELDISCIELENLYEEIRELFSSDAWREYRPSPMRLVCAPKAAKWDAVGGNLVPKNGGGDGIPLRPLAHLQIKDQTIAMMFLMCLANGIETAQGPVDDFCGNGKWLTASYGNRLRCDWSGRGVGAPCRKAASFLWGNAETYDKYYKDYEKFVKRPEMAVRAYRENGGGGSVYVLSLDIKGFYDNIRTSDVVKKVASSFGLAQSDDFILALSRVLSFSWDRESQKVLRELEMDSFGLPQGLVASGFFANIALLDFDKLMRDFVFSGHLVPHSGKQIKVIDYSRYVDDMRVVFSISGECDEDLLREEVVDFIQERLSSCSTGLSFNRSKSKLKLVNDGEAVDLIGVQMSEIKEKASGPIDVYSAWELLRINTNLGALSAAANDDERHVIRVGGLRFEKGNSGITPETVGRFRAYNWRKNYRILAAALPQGEVDNFNGRAGSRRELDAMTENYCREVFYDWLKDPSNIRVLRISFDLCPNKEWLGVVIAQMIGLAKKSRRGALYAAYVLSELYRGAAIEPFGGVNGDLCVGGEDLSGFKDLLECEIFEIMDAFNPVPWYLANQLALYVLVNGLSIRGKDQIFDSADDHYSICGKILEQRFVGKLGRNDLPLLLIACGINPNVALRPNVREYVSRIFDLDVKHARNILTTFDEGGQMLPAPASWKDKSSCLRRKKMRSVEDIIRMTDLSGVSEVEVVRIALAICDSLLDRGLKSGRYLTPARVKIFSSEWKNLKNPSVSCRLHVKFDFSEQRITDFLFAPDEWDEGVWSQSAQLGRIIRALLVCSEDYTKIRRNALIVGGGRKNVAIGCYHGVRSSWVKRHFGLYFDKVSLGVTGLQISPFLSDLLSRLLAWPGGWRESQSCDLTIDNVRELLQCRLNDLARYYGRASDSLIVPVDVDLTSIGDENQCRNNSRGKLNVVIVQNCYPKVKDFVADMPQNASAARSKLKLHFADICQLIESTFQTHKDVLHDVDSVNLIVFPEVSIHASHLDDVKKLADEYNCIVFCGLVFCPCPWNPGKFINTGVWVIPQKKRVGRAREFTLLYQGKKHPISMEKKGGVIPWRPVQWLVCGKVGQETVWRITASMCYDSTDIKLASDLRDIADCYIISAFNRDVNVFDAMAEAMRYHLYNHTVIANSGEYGGSTIQAPYENTYDRMLLHAHGTDQVLVAIKTLMLSDFSKAYHKTSNIHKRHKDHKKRKTSPAGFIGRSDV